MQFHFHLNLRKKWVWKVDVVGCIIATTTRQSERRNTFQWRDHRSVENDESLRFRAAK